jgi:hypothetical protein
MRIKKMLISAMVIFYTASFANGELMLLVNGLDASNAIEIEPNATIIISVSGVNDTNESYTVACEEGCTLEVYQGPNTPSKQTGYLLIIEDEIPALPIVSLTVAGKLDYQLAFFIIPDANTVIFGIDSDSLDYVPQPSVQQQEIVVSQAVLSSSSGGEMLYAMGAMDCNEVLDPNFFPNLNNDSFVNFVDFVIFAENWLKSGESLDGDFNGSETVDYYDLKYLSYFWLANTCGPSPQEVFAEFKEALLADDVNEAVSYFVEVSAENYRLLLEQLRPFFTQMANDMGDLVPISSDGVTAVYDLLREEDGDTYGYPVLFIRDGMGRWKIYDF